MPSCAIQCISRAVLLCRDLGRAGLVVGPREHPHLRPLAEHPNRHRGEDAAARPRRLCGLCCMPCTLAADSAHLVRATLSKCLPLLSGQSMSARCTSIGHLEAIASWGTAQHEDVPQSPELREDIIVRSPTFP